MVEKTDNKGTGNYDREKLIEEIKPLITKCALSRKFVQENLNKLKKIYEVDKDPEIMETIEDTEDWLKMTEGTPEMEDFHAGKESLGGN